MYVFNYQRCFFCTIELGYVGAIFKCMGGDSTLWFRWIMRLSGGIIPPMLGDVFWTDWRYPLNILWTSNLVKPIVQFELALCVHVCACQLNGNNERTPFNWIELLNWRLLFLKVLGSLFRNLEEDVLIHTSANLNLDHLASRFDGLCPGRKSGSSRAKGPQDGRGENMWIPRAHGEVENGLLRWSSFKAGLVFDCFFFLFFLGFPAISKSVCREFIYRQPHEQAVEEVEMPSVQAQSFRKVKERT